MHHGDPRLGFGAGPLYGKPAVQFIQPMMNTRPPAPAVTQEVAGTTSGEASAFPSGTAPQSAVTPGLFSVTAVLISC